MNDVRYRRHGYNNNCMATFAVVDDVIVVEAAATADAVFKVVSL